MTGADPISPPPLPRRRFMQLAAGGLGATVAAYGLYRWVSPDPAGAGYGPLLEAGPELALPQGFRYRELSFDGRIMSDGRPTPRMPDGMAAFATDDGAIRLIRNHELEGRPDDPVTDGYDAQAPGGTTTLEIDPVERTVIADWVSLAGTVRNCAGGATPWSSWISCEETVDGPEQGYDEHHGYAFDVPADAEGPVLARPLTAMGRFRREAVAVDERAGIVYQTEDADPVAGFYRYVVDAGPSAPGTPLDLAGGGRLQAMEVAGRPGADLRSVIDSDGSFAVGWVDIDEPDPDIEGGLTVMDQALSAGAARFRRLEGCVMEGSSVWFTSTSGGFGNGQIWRFDPDDPNGDRGRLTMVVATETSDVLAGPDNLVLSPQGSLVICEDSSRGSNRLVALSPEGVLVHIAENIGNDREFAGATFSPDGATLFVNIQGSASGEILGRTMAIWGPWEKGVV